MTTPIPERLQLIAQPPAQLYVQGTPLAELLAAPCVAIVGSRAASPYGRQLTETLATQLAQRGITIISGLAFGIDSIAHQAALNAGGKTIAVLPGSIAEVYPRSHKRLAQDIVARGGALVSEYPPGTPIMAHSFIHRNRLIAGLADATLVTEAALKSGSLHTAGYALEQGKIVLAVPGPVTSPTSTGTNNLLKHSAVPVTSVADVLEALNLESTTQPLIIGDSEHEQRVITALRAGHTAGHDMLAYTQLHISDFNQALVMLEIHGKVRALGNNLWSLCR